MKTTIKSAFLGFVLVFSVLVRAAPPSPAESMQPSTVLILLNGTSNETISALGYDPSIDYQGWATVEVRTGGSKRKPVNVGNVVGHDLHAQIFRLLNIACPSMKPTPVGMYCDSNNKWQSFQTKYLDRPPAGIKETATFLKTNSAQWATEELRVIMMNIVGRVLYAYTNQPLGTNCYEVPGQGRYCNVPQFVRVNLPKGNPVFPNWDNKWHVEIWGGPHQFSQHGNLKPCGTRGAVDAELDKYQGQLEGQFPEWKGRFKRDTRVIINGYKMCSDEP